MTYWYLGPEWLPECIRKRLPFAKEFKPAAKGHDIGYSRGINGRDRKRSDVMFFRMMIASTQQMNVKKSIKAIFSAIIYYIAVRIGGPLSFNYYWRKDFMKRRQKRSP